MSAHTIVTHTQTRGTIGRVFRAKSFDKLPEEDRSFGPESTFGPEKRKKQFYNTSDCAETYCGAMLIFLCFSFQTLARANVFTKICMPPALEACKGEALTR